MSPVWPWASYLTCQASVFPSMKRSVVPISKDGLTTTAQECPKASQRGLPSLPARDRALFLFDSSVIRDQSEPRGFGPPFNPQQMAVFCVSGWSPLCSYFLPEGGIPTVRVHSSPGSLVIVGGWQTACQWLIATPLPVWPTLVWLRGLQSRGGMFCLRLFKKLL